MTLKRKIIYETEESLRILGKMEANPHLSQWELSLGLGLSLGKIKLLLKELTDRGLAKAANFKNSSNKRSYLYLNTTGIEIKAKPAYYFLKRKTEEYEELEIEIAQLRKELGFSVWPLRLG